jgi:predicted DNA-binding transcriptional regulator AlpA
MPREIVNLEDLCKRLPLTKHQVYKLVRDPVHPLPYRKCGKRLLFDVSKVYQWFDSLPGADQTSEGTGF